LTFSGFIVETTPPDGIVLYSIYRRYTAQYTAIPDYRL